MIATQAVSKSYGSTKALQALTLTVQPGEVLGLLGPNGAPRCEPRPWASSTDDPISDR